ncbi:hypothetical protein ABVT39_024671 [Epinephelus coioides]
MADEAAVVEEGVGPAQTPLVTVSFQKNANRKEKYLEAEPKALGITQIGLSLFKVTCVVLFLSQGLGAVGTDVPFFISSLLVIIAGSLAIAAQNLHLPTLRACFGMQIVACAASIFNIILSLIKMNESSYECYGYYYSHNSEEMEKCRKYSDANSHLFAEGIAIQVALLAISFTLVAYCYKVINCCSPAPKMPVITVQAPPVQQ